jgi:hypothetical protein
LLLGKVLYGKCCEKIPEHAGMQQQLLQPWRHDFISFTDEAILKVQVDPVLF